MPRHISIIAICVCLTLLVLPATTLPQGPPNRTSDVPVTSTINDSFNGIPMQIQSDSAGPYRNTKYVQSIVQGAVGYQDWELDTNYSTFSTRNVWLDFTKPVAGSGPNNQDPIAPFDSALAKVRFISKCHEYNVSMFSIPLGTTVNCPLATGFNYGGIQYRLHMNPLSGPDINPETDYVNITCNAVNSALQCINWTIEPNASKGGCASVDCTVKQNVARLSKMVTSKGKTTPVNQGNFYISFRIDLTNP